MNLAIQNRVYRQKSTTLLMVGAHQKREHEEAAECVFYDTSYVTILSFIKCGCHDRNKSMRWRPERSAGKQIMRPTLAQLRAAITAYRPIGLTQNPQIKQLKNCPCTAHGLFHRKQITLEDRPKLKQLTVSHIVSLLR